MTRVISTAAEAQAWLTEQQFCAGPWGWDCETEGIDPRKQPAAGDNGRMVCFTVATPVRVLAGELQVDSAFFWANEAVLSVIGPWWKDAPVVGHNLYGFDAHLCRRAGYPLGDIVMDTLRASRIVETHPDAQHGLKPLMARWLGIEPVGAFADLFTRKVCLEEVEASELKLTRRKFDDAFVPTLVGGAHSRFGEMTEFVPLSQIPDKYTALLPALYEYALLDAEATLRLWWIFSQRMAAMPWGMTDVPNRQPVL